MAMLDAILSPEWEYRHYSFDTNWSHGEQMGSMRNGQGDAFFALFSPSGCFLKGFAHEAPMSPYRSSPNRVWTGVLDAVPIEFERGLNEPAFSMEDTTFCIWRRAEDESWHHGPVKFPSGDDPDGSEMLLSSLDGRPETYQGCAEDYYERPISLDLIRDVYAHTPLTESMVQQLNPETSLSDLAEDIWEIGYPLQGQVE